MTDLAPPPKRRPQFALAPAARPVSEVPIGRSLRGTAAVVLVAAVLADLSLQTRVGGVAAAAMVLVLCWGLWQVGWVVRPGGRVLLGLAGALAPFLVLRASPWLVVGTLAAIAVLLALACTATTGARWFDVSALTALSRLVSAAGSILGATPATARLVAGIGAGASAADRRTWTSILRGLGIAAPIIAALALSLASADAVFASVFDLGVDGSDVVLHVAVLIAAAIVATGWFVAASRPPTSPIELPKRLGGIEALVITIALDAVYLVYAATQLLVARRGPAYVMERTGLSYAEYARSGFFQLLWVAAATALVLAALRGSTGPAGRAVQRGLAAAGAASAALTLVVVHSALVRLELYEQEFGLTLLRFASSAFAWWLGAVFVLIGASFLLHRRSTREWLPAGIAASALVAIVVVNVINPEQAVVEHNVARATAGEPIDVEYLLLLSDDATPALVDAIDQLVPSGQMAPLDAERLEAVLCDRQQVEPTRWSISNWQASGARSQLCG